MSKSKTVLYGGSLKIRILRVVFVVVCSLAAWCLLAYMAAQALIVKTGPTHADALVVLGGASTYLERTAWAAKLFSEGRAPKVILTNDNLQSGWLDAQQRNPIFVERAAAELQRRGVPAQSIEIIPQPISSTYEEAVQLRRYAETHKARSLLLITSAYHSRRALWTLRHVFQGTDTEIGVDPVATGLQTPAPASWWGHKSGWRWIPGEYLKLLYYRARY
ncbi:MAG: YdcF family protein [Pyrinomonadaceae bacterium]